MENVLGVFPNGNFYPIPCLGQEVIFLGSNNENLVGFLEVKPRKA